MTLGGVCCVASSFPCGALKKQISEMVFCSRVIITGFSHFARNPAKIRKSAFLGTAARSTEFVPRVSLVQKRGRPWKRGADARCLSILGQVLYLLLKMRTHSNTGSILEYPFTYLHVIMTRYQTPQAFPFLGKFCAFFKTASSHDHCPTLNSIKKH